MTEIIEYPMTYMKRHRLDVLRRRARRAWWDDANRRMDSGESINFPITTTEELHNEKP